MFRRDQYFRHWQFDFNFLFQLSEPFYLFNLNLLSSKQRLLSISDSSGLTYFEIQLWWRRSIKKVIKEAVGITGYETIAEYVSLIAWREILVQQGKFWKHFAYRSISKGLPTMKRSVAKVPNLFPLSHWYFHLY